MHCKELTCVTMGGWPAEGEVRGACRQEERAGTQSTSCSPRVELLPGGSLRSALQGFQRTGSSPLLISEGHLLH